MHGLSSLIETRACEYWLDENNSEPFLFMCVVCVQYESGPVNPLPSDMSRLPGMELEDSGLPSLADLSTSDLKYQSYSMKGTGDTGCSLRYFSIQPVVMVRLLADSALLTNVMFMYLFQRSDTPVEQSDLSSRSHRDSYLSTASADSLDALRLSTTFVKEVVPGSLAERAGLEKGFVVHMINKDSILRYNMEQMRALVEQW